MMVNDLIKTFDRKPLEVAKHPVAIDSVKNALVQRLNLNSPREVVRVGIWGFGGTGKTTAARALYNQVYTDFEAASFVFNVGATGLTDLQKQILEDLTKYDGKVHSVEHGKSLFRDRLGGKRVLLILDDVDAVEQLNALLGDWLFGGSRVVITSRDKHILNVAGVSSGCIHEMTGLEMNEGLELFSWHAFNRASPMPRYEDMSKIIVDACKGHPHSLEVMGSYLCDKVDDIYWTQALHIIRFDQDIHKRLYRSYSALLDVEKEIFIDIACHLNGEEKELPFVFWKSLYETADTAVLNLEMKALIKIDHDGVIHMHVRLQDLGQSIAGKEKERTRFWQAAHLRTLPNNNNCSRIQLNERNPQRLQNFYRPGLCYLHFQDLPIQGRIEDSLAMLPTSLIWLRLENCRFETGSNRAVKKPRHSRFVDNIWQLKIVQLKGCSDLDSLSLSSLFSLCNIQLQHLDLGGCESIYNLPHTIGNLSQLQKLGLRGCKNLIGLPDTIGKLWQLQNLDLGLCYKLNNLPDSISNLARLESLNLEWCVSLESLPGTIGNLSQLQYLNLKNCGNLENLPNSICDLSRLLHFYLERCVKLHELPGAIGNLSQLQHLNMFACLNLENLPDSIVNLSQLQHLDLRMCERLSNLPNTIGNLSQLQDLLFERV